ncbi:MAG: preprotein translocase subunit SecG [bacterium]
MIFNIFLFIEIIASILLIIVILMQSSKGGGLAGTFGTTGIGTMFGIRRASDFLTKSTTILATVILVLALFINLALLRRESSPQSIIQSAPAPVSVPPSLPQDQQPASQPAATPEKK